MVIRRLLIDHLTNDRNLWTDGRSTIYLRTCEFLRNIDLTIAADDKCIPFLVYDAAVLELFVFFLLSHLIVLLYSYRSHTLVSLSKNAPSMPTGNRAFQSNLLYLLTSSCCWKLKNFNQPIWPIGLRLTGLVSELIEPERELCTDKESFQTIINCDVTTTDPQARTAASEVAPRN